MAMQKSSPQNASSQIPKAGFAPETSSLENAAGAKSLRQYVDVG